MTREQNVAAVDLDQCGASTENDPFCWYCRRTLEHPQLFLANGEETNHYDFSDLIQEKTQQALAPLAKSKALVTTHEGERTLLTPRQECIVDGIASEGNGGVNCVIGSFLIGLPARLFLPVLGVIFSTVLAAAICGLIAILEAIIAAISCLEGASSRRLEAYVETDENPGEPPEITASFRHLHENLLPKESLAIDSAHYDPKIASYAFQDKPQNETTGRRLRGFADSRQFVGIVSGEKGYQVRYVKFRVWSHKSFMNPYCNDQCETTANKKEGNKYIWEVTCYNNDKPLESAWITWRGRSDVRKVHGRIFERHTLTRYWRKLTSIPVIFTCSNQDGFSALQTPGFRPIPLAGVKELRAENCDTICRAYARRSHGKRIKRGTRWDAESDHAVQLANW